MAADLHSPASVTATPVSTETFATAGKPPAPIAPGAGGANATPPFGQQLQDARDSASHPSEVHSAVGSQTDQETAAQTKSRRAAARPTDKKDSEKGSAGTAATAAAAPPPLPFSFGFPILVAGLSGDNAALSAGGSRNAPGGAAQGSDQAAGTEADGARQDAAPVPVAGDTASQSMTGDLSFALKLNSSASGAGTNGQAPSPAQGDTPGTSVAPAGTGQTQDPLQSSPGADKASAPAQDGVSVGLNAISKQAAVAPVKDAHQSNAGQDSGQSGQPNQTQNIQMAAVPVAAKSAATSSAPAASSNQAPRPDAAAKALDAPPIQGPASDPSAKPAGPLKELAIQVGQTSHEKVELRVVDRAGELQVAVRASNADLAQGLRQGLSDLVDRLEQNGFRAEAWRPGMAASTVPGTADARQKQAQFQNEGGQPQSGGSPQGRQQNGQNQSRPRWVQELEGSLTGGQSSFQGESYGISR